MEMVSKKVFCVALLCMVMIAAAPGAEALTCGQVVSILNPCLPYLTSRGPLGGCCPAVKNLVSRARTTPDRQSACNCLKSASKSIPSLNLANAAGLPRQCGVSIPYKISPSTDCTRVR